MRFSFSSISKVAGFLGFFSATSLGFSTLVEASCRHDNGLGVNRTVTLDTTGGARFGASHGGHREFLRHKEVVLTFDDGPVPGKTAKVLAALDRHCTKATFFIVGQMAANYPGLVKQVLAKGHTVGAHSYTHRNLGDTNGAVAIDDVHRSIKAINKAAGRKTTAFFRFPYLAENRTVNAMLLQRDYGIFAVDVDSKDYKFAEPTAMVNRVMSELKRKGKGIILMHDIQAVTANGLDELLDRLDQEGYRIVHVRGSAGRGIDEPMLLASNEEQPKKANASTADAGRTQSIEAKPKSIKVAELSKRQREIIKKRQRIFKEQAIGSRQTFRSIVKRRLITQ